MNKIDIIYNENCIEVLKRLEDNSIDAIVTDPPYNLGFMGKKWDKTGIAFNLELWEECLRVIKPGGNLLAFGGTRTYHMKREANGSKTYRKPFNPTEYGKRYNIWEYDIGGESWFDHPAIFPEALASDHIISWSNASDIVLDPFMGSGTTLYCAKKLGRKCIGIEIEEKYCKIAKDRLAQSAMRLE